MYQYLSFAVQQSAQLSAGWLKPSDIATGGVMTQSMQAERGPSRLQQGRIEDEVEQGAPLYPDVRDYGGPDDGYDEISRPIDTDPEPRPRNDKRQSRIEERRPESSHRVSDRELSETQQSTSRKNDHRRDERHDQLEKQGQDQRRDQRHEQRQSHHTTDPSRAPDRRAQQSRTAEPANSRHGNGSARDHQRQQSRAAPIEQEALIPDESGKWFQVMLNTGPAWIYPAAANHGPPTHGPIDSRQEAKRLREERNDLRDELASTERELHRTKAALDSLQDTALSSVDRFSPLTDGVIEEKFLILAGKIKGLGNFLAKSTKSSMDNRAWTSAMKKKSWPGSCADSKLDPTKDSDFRKLLWRMVLWSWIDDAVVRDPFQAFGGVAVQVMHDAYNTLFPVGRKPEDAKASLYFPRDPEAAKWRAISVHYLKQNGAAKFDGERKTQLRHELDELLSELECSLSKPDPKGDFEAKINGVLSAALVFAQISVGQRAIYQLYVPRLKPGDVKSLQGTRFTSIDEEFGTAEDEEAGEVRYIGRPGLLRRGTSMGYDFDKESVLLQRPFAMLNIKRDDD